MEGVTFAPDGSILPLEIAQTMIFNIECDGIADWSGTGDAASASGLCVGSGGFFLANGRPDAMPIIIHLSIREFYLQGNISLDASEVAAMELYVHLEPASEIRGSHDNPVWSAQRNTRRDGIDNFEIFGIPEELFFDYELPGGEEGASPGEFILRFLAFNFRVGIRGQAISLLSRTGVSLPLTSVPPPPSDSTPSLDVLSRIQNMRNYYEAAVKNGLITGLNGNKQNVGMYRDLLDAFESRWAKQKSLEACNFLVSAILQSDDLKGSAPDLITGPALPEFRRIMKDVAGNAVECPIPHPK
jgi:hypothetical protein